MEKYIFKKSEKRIKEFPQMGLIAKSGLRAPTESCLI